MALKAGEWDRRLKIQRYTVTRNELNEEIRTWSDLATVWSAKGYRRANEGRVSGEVAAIRVDRFEIEWTPTVADVSPKDRLEYPAGSGVYWDISEVNEIGRKEGLEIFAAARADGGEA